MAIKYVKPTEYVNMLVDMDFGEKETSVGEEPAMLDQLDVTVTSAGRKTKVTKVKTLPPYKNGNVKKRLEGLKTGELVIYRKNSKNSIISEDVIRDPRMLR